MGFRIGNYDCPTNRMSSNCVYVGNAPSPANRFNQPRMGNPDNFPSMSIDPDKPIIVRGMNGNGGGTPMSAQSPRTIRPPVPGPPVPGPPPTYELLGGRQNHNINSHLELYGHDSPPNRMTGNPIVRINLEAKPGQFVFRDSGQPYVGLYHIHQDGTIMINAGVMGAVHDVNPSEILVPAGPRNTPGNMNNLTRRDIPVPNRMSQMRNQTSNTNRNISSVGGGHTHDFTHTHDYVQHSSCYCECRHQGDQQVLQPFMIGPCNVESNLSSDNTTTGQQNCESNCTAHCMNFGDGDGYNAGWNYHYSQCYSNHGTTSNPNGIMGRSGNHRH